MAANEIEYIKVGNGEAWPVRDNSKAPAGYGLGGAQLITATNIDTLINPGFYYIDESMTICLYTTNKWWIHVYAHSTGDKYVTQTATTFSSNVGVTLIRHKINGTWSEWEWENPPMAAGTEYRTTERWDGKPVYRKRVSYSNTTSIGSTSRNNDISVSHGISKLSSVIRCDAVVNGSIPLPRVTTSGGITSVPEINSSSIVLRLYKDTWSASSSFTFDIAYVKSST